jgi:DNA polymerase-3 subunit gamma/tau
VGQAHVSEVLTRAVESGRVAHAYLFTGARGVGKTTSARILAKALNCERRASGELEGADPCNTCTSCTEITSGVSLDVSEIDGASNRGIADVQALREKVRFTPAGGHYRVVIIDEVHQLSGDAFAALLKTLEEPPPHLVFIFATTDPQKVPDTIRSRTQRFDFARVPLRKVAERLETIQAREAEDADGVRFTLSEGAALLMAHKSEGSMRDAVSALDQVISSGETALDEAVVRRVLGIADREAFFALAEAITRRDSKAALVALHAGFAKGVDPRELAEGLSEHIRHLLILKVDPKADDLVAASADDLARLRAQTEGWEEHDLLRLLRLATEASWPMRDSPQPLIHLEAAVLQMASLEPSRTLAEILRRLEELEQRLDGAGGDAPATGARAPGRAGTTGAGPSATQVRSAAPSPTPASGVVSTRGAMPAATPLRAAPGPPAGLAPPAAGPVTRWPGAAPAASPPGGVRLNLAGAPFAGAGASGATAVADDDEPRLDPMTGERWQQVIASVNERKRMLGAFLQESQFLGRARRGLVLATDDLHRAVIEEAENRTLVADAAARVFGERIALCCTAATGEASRRPASLADVGPMIDRAIAWFEGDVIERPGRAAERTDG